MKVIKILTVETATKLSETWNKPLKTLNESIYDTANTKEAQMDKFGEDRKGLQSSFLKTYQPNGLVCKVHFCCS